MTLLWPPALSFEPLQFEPPFQGFVDETNTSRTTFAKRPLLSQRSTSDTGPFLAQLLFHSVCQLGLELWFSTASALVFLLLVIRYATLSLPAHAPSQLRH